MTDDADKSLEDDLSRFSAMMEKRKANTEQCTAEIREVLLKYCPDPQDEDAAPDASDMETRRSSLLKVEDVLAEAIRLFAVGGITELYLEWTASAYMRQDIEVRMDLAERIHYRLSTEGYTREKPYSFNDLDNRAFYVPLEVSPHESDSRIAFCLEDQNLRFLFIITVNLLGKKFRCCRYWDRLDPEHASFDLTEPDKVLFALQNAEWIVEHYSDCTAEKPDGKWYRPNRPDLDWFLKRNLEEYGEKPIGYGDGRDPHHVFNLGTGMMGAINDSSMLHLAQFVGMALSDIDGCWDELGGNADGS